jgi:hypothetical protein
MVDKKPQTRLSAGGWIVIAVLTAALLATCWYSLRAWNSVDAELSGIGWGFMIAGVVVSVALGGGLMALVFYSNRHNLDR